MHPTILQQIVTQHVSSLRADAAEQRIIRQLPARDTSTRQRVRRWYHRSLSRYSLRHAGQSTVRRRRWAGPTAAATSSDEPTTVPLANQA
jgi:hypothetical protein